MSNLPPMPGDYAYVAEATDRPTWKGMPELPPGYRWITYALEPAIVNKKKNPRTPIAWVTANVENETLCKEIWILPTTTPMSCTVVEACHILAAKCWLGEF